VKRKMGTEKGCVHPRQRHTEEAGKKRTQNRKPRKRGLRNAKEWERGRRMKERTTLARHERR